MRFGVEIRGGTNLLELKSLGSLNIRRAIFSVENGKAVGYIEFNTRKHAQAVAKKLKTVIGQCLVHLDPCGRGYIGAAAAYRRVIESPKQTQVLFGSGEFNPHVLRHAKLQLRAEARQTIMAQSGYEQASSDELHDLGTPQAEELEQRELQPTDKDEIAALKRQLEQTETQMRVFQQQMDEVRSTLLQMGNASTMVDRQSVVEQGISWEEHLKLETKYAKLMAMFNTEVDKRKAAEAVANTAVTMQNILDAVNTIIAARPT